MDAGSLCVVFSSAMRSILFGTLADYGVFVVHGDLHRFNGVFNQGRFSDTGVPQFCFPLSRLCAYFLLVSTTVLVTRFAILQLLCDVSAMKAAA